MASLLDLEAPVEFVTVASTRVEVYGISARGIAHLLGRFPELRKMMTGIEVNADDLMKVGPDAVAAIIAAGTGKPGNQKAEQIADNMPLDTQVDFLAKILRLTMPQGVGPFVEKLTAAMGGLGVETSATAPATSSPSPSSS